MDAAEIDMAGIGDRLVGVTRRARRCDGCDYSMILKGSGEQLFCTAEPPKLHMRPTPGKIVGQMEMQISALFPPVEPEWRCRRFFPKDGNLE